MSDLVNDRTSPQPRYQRCTRLGDGCFTVSTVSAWLCCRWPETAIFDERSGNARFLEQHISLRTREQLDAAHEAVCARFAAGEIQLWRMPSPSPDVLRDEHAREE